MGPEDPSNKKIPIIFFKAKSSEIAKHFQKCSTICGTPVQAILDQKSLTRLAEGVREGLKYGLECASSNDRNGLNLASEPSRGP